MLRVFGPILIFLGDFNPGVKTITYAYFLLFLFFSLDFLATKQWLWLIRIMETKFNND